MNKVIIIGNVTKDPDYAQTSTGTSVCRFTVAVNRTYTNANGEREADFINVVTWRGLAESCDQNVVKGMKVAVCGSLQTSSYEDKQGEKRYRTDVVADSVEFVSRPNKDAAEGKEADKVAKKKKLSDLKPTDDDGLPF